MPRFHLALLVSFLSFAPSAFSQEAADLAAAKQEMTSHLDARITSLQEAKNCIASAQTREAMRACHEELKDDHREMRADRLEKRKQRLEAKTQKLEERKAKLESESAKKK